MKSAYVTLGVPGNVSDEDLKVAYDNVLATFTKEKLAANSELLARREEVKIAYTVLSNKESRAAHDRKLNHAAAPRPVRIVEVPTQETSSSATVMKIGAVLVVAMFGAGLYMNTTREQARKEKEAHELALKKLDAEEAEKQRQQQLADDAEKARQRAIAENNERRNASEAAASYRQAKTVEALQQSAMQRQVQIDKNYALQEERLRQMDAQRRIADDQRRIRNLCLQNYGRPVC